MTRPLACSARCANTQRGATILEVLVAVLILAIAILGTVGMQAVSIRNLSASKYRSQASYLADQIVGQMWADRNNLASYADNPVSGANACAPSGAQSAYPAVTTWLAAVAQALPGAPASMQQIAVGANNVVTVTVCWKAPEDTTVHDFSETAEING